MKVYVVGISGVSGGGKSTLANSLFDYLSERTNANVLENHSITRVSLIAQDKYFYPRDSPHHIWIKDMNFINREVLSAIDGERLWTDIADCVLQLSEVEASAHEICILLIEGFLIFNDDRINELCDLRLHVTLTPEEGLRRRMTRTWKHVNPDPAKYFKEYMWPSYVKHLEIVKNRDQIHYLNGENTRDELFKESLRLIIENTK